MSKYICPKCGAESDSLNGDLEWNSYRCQTLIQDGFLKESKMCLRNQLATEKEKNERLRGIVEKLLESISPFLGAAYNRADFDDDTWNPDAHVEITVSIFECRSLAESVKAAEAAKEGE